MNKQKVEDWLVERFAWKGHDTIIKDARLEAVGDMLMLSADIDHKTEHGWESESIAILHDFELARVRGWVS